VDVDVWSKALDETALPIHHH